MKQDKFLYIAIAILIAMFLSTSVIVQASGDVTTTSTLTDTLVFGDEMGRVNMLGPSGSSVIFQIPEVESGSMVVRDVVAQSNTSATTHAVWVLAEDGRLFRFLLRGEVVDLSTLRSWQVAGGDALTVFGSRVFVSNRETGVTLYRKVGGDLRVRGVLPLLDVISMRATKSSLFLIQRGEGVMEVPLDFQPQMSTGTAKEIWNGYGSPTALVLVGNNLFVSSGTIGDNPSRIGRFDRRSGEQVDEFSKPLFTVRWSSRRGIAATADAVYVISFREKCEIIKMDYDETDFQSFEVVAEVDAELSGLAVLKRPRDPAELLETAPQE
jgi:hypothetical protein